MLAVSLCRVMLREAHYFTYRGESIRTVHYWFRIHDYEEIFFWKEEDNKMEHIFGPQWYEQATLEDTDVVVMYNREDRHWCYEPSLDLSDFTEQKCGTVTMYVRNGN